jgi:hypothetical protein
MPTQRYCSSRLTTVCLSSQKNFNKFVRTERQRKTRCKLPNYVRLCQCNQPRKLTLDCYLLVINNNNNNQQNNVNLYYWHYHSIISFMSYNFYKKGLIKSNKETKSNDRTVHAKLIVEIKSPANVTPEDQSIIYYFYWGVVNFELFKDGLIETENRYKYRSTKFSFVSFIISCEIIPCLQRLWTKFTIISSTSDTDVSLLLASSSGSSHGEQDCIMKSLVIALSDGAKELDYRHQVACVRFYRGASATLREKINFDLHGNKTCTHII